MKIQGLSNFFSALLVLLTVCACAAPIELQKVYHHRFSAHQNGSQGLPVEPHIELAKIVLYFNQEPVLKKQELKADSGQFSFFVPQATIAATTEAKQAIDALNAQKSAYRVSITSVQSPAPGIQINFWFDPKKVTLHYDFFDVIKGEKAIEFRLHDKTILEILKSKHGSVLRTTYDHKPTIIIDCGHGGADFGAVGLGKTVEKNITLAVGKQLGQELQNGGFPVLLTRNADTFIALDERTFIANQRNNAIVISLHANSAPKNAVHGLETFCLAMNLFKNDEHALQTSIDVLIKQYDEWQCAESKKLADSVHAHILATMNKNGFALPDRKIRHKAAQILLGSKCPAILVEMEYVTNQQGAQWLNNPNYQRCMVQGLCAGVKEYLKVA